MLEVNKRFRDFECLHETWVRPACAEGLALRLPRKFIAKNDEQVVEGRVEELDWDATDHNDIVILIKPGTMTLCCLLQNTQ